MGRLGVGPVFVWEWRRVSRQWWFYAMRSALVGALLAGLGAVWWVLASQPTPNAPRLMARVGEAFFEVIVLGQIAMVLLSAPAATAGTFGMDKARGHVCLMLITEVTSLDIVLGVLAARLLPVVGGVLCVVPVLALTSHLGGAPPVAMVDLLAVTVGSAADVRAILHFFKMMCGMILPTRSLRPWSSGLSIPIAMPSFGWAQQDGHVFPTRRRGPSEGRLNKGVCEPTAHR